MFDPLIAMRIAQPPQVRSRYRADAIAAHARSFTVICWFTVIGCWLVGTAASIAAPPPAAEPVAAETVDDQAAEALAKWKSTGLPLMQSYCSDCHNQDLQEGGLDLSPFESLTDLSAAEVKRVLEMVQFGAMPPEDYEAPEIAERKQLVQALEATMHSSVCDLTPRAGKVTVRRLNRNEYNHTIRDLFGMDLRPADQFPSDEVGAGFDNNGDVLSLSPMLIEKCIEAAESVSQQVIIDPTELPELDLSIPGDQLLIYGEPKIGRFGGRFVDAESFAWMDLAAPYEGDYEIEVRGGTSSREREQARIAICDGQGKLLAVDELQYYGGGGDADSMRETIHLSAGKHRLTFVPVLDDQELKIGETVFERIPAMQQDRIDSLVAALGKANSPDDRIDEDQFMFMFRSLKVSGPSEHPRDAYPPKQFEIVRSIAPRKRDRYSDVEETSMKNLRPLMKTVFRGPVSDDEVRPYAKLVKQSVDEGASFHRGTQIALSAILISPRFLFRVEQPDAGQQPNEFGDIPLSQHQLATRLSYFLWSSTPDAPLMQLADDQSLDGDVLEQQVRRMLSDDRADSMATDFAAQWLGLRNLAEHEADAERFPGFDGELKAAMARETELLFLHVLRNDLPISEFLTADYTFVNSMLAEHYGIAMDSSANSNDRAAGAYQQVSLTGTPRRGMLSHASVLTLTSTPNRTSPVLRGKWILENVMGTRAPDPPAGVPELEASQTADSGASLRQQFELHRTNPTCASCHRVMDQLGFGLDDFDAIGRYRSLDAGKPIDASGALPDGRSFVGGAELSRMLAETEVDGLARTLTERLLTFAIGRELSADDRCTVEEIVARTKDKHYRLADIVTEVATCRQFRYQTSETVVARPQGN